MPHISILIGVYNEALTIDACFASIHAQTYDDYEIICIDDCSTDGTQDILLSWQKRFTPDQLIILHNPKNYGLTRSLNTALKKARGQYIARIDGDDIWEPAKLEKQVAFLKSHPDYGIVGCNHTNVYKGNITPKQILLPETHEEISQKLFRRNPFAHSCILAKTDLLRQVGGYNTNIYYGQDYDLWLRCFPLTRFHNLQESLCARNISGGISVTKQDAQMWQSIKTRIKYIHKYRYNLKNYFYLLEPLGVILTPDGIKKLKRRYL